ncbi:hypothetical protein DFJ58DRAFT_735297 [Suillus subalutaceus]|uniref:uncharacterized protein n=1 Tax=Suillus subalutaceus TaxID=48586 RepID=UPI001B871A00|nr:uncharacterized protein DFJ58DRAFT_735297 [Suillus subalutaceus]KAG1835971.1 hypothetical protein DFJ58DRAFT_735297 [Suillus subalutaceus]
MDQESDPKLNDVLNLHHKRNGHPRLPHPALLELLCAAEIDTSNSKAKQKWKHKQKSKIETEVKGVHTGRVSSRMRRWSVIPSRHWITLSLSLIHDLPVSITELLLASLVQWLKNGQQVDAGVWPARKPDMARLLYDDLATWRSDLKKIAISSRLFRHTVFPHQLISPVEERAAWVEAAAAELLDGGRFLRFGLDELGKTRNFAHPALLQAIVLFFYTGTYQSLVCTAGLKKNGNGKSYSKFTSKEYELVYHSMLALLDDVMKDPYHGPKLVQQLREWAKIGWAEASKLDGVDMLKHHHLRVQLD